MRMTTDFYFTGSEWVEMITLGLAAIAVVALGLWIFWPRRRKLKGPGFPVMPRKTD